VIVAGNSSRMALTDSQIDAYATSPKKVQTDGLTVEAHPLKEQMDAKCQEASGGALRALMNGGRSFILNRIRPSGSI